MKILFQVKLWCFMSACIFIHSVHADNLGRVFTSTEERQELEKIRNSTEKPKKVEKVEVVEKEVVQKQIIIRDPITLKGLVHRSGGRSTAWLNDSNTFEGGYDSQSIQVHDSNIKPDQVTVIMPDDSEAVDLRVGDVFIPYPIEKNVNE